MWYAAGKHAAFEKLGMSTGLREGLLRALQHPVGGEYLTRLPLYTAVGTGIGALSDAENRGRGALLGALGGVSGGFTAAAAPQLRARLIQKLQQGAR